MKLKYVLPVTLMVVFAGTGLVDAQTVNEKKIERIHRKIEKQTQKLQKLQGDPVVVEGFPMDVIPPEEIEAIRIEARAHAAEAREMAREAGEQAREMAREAGEQAREAAEHAREAAHRGVIIMRDEVRRAHDRGRFEEMEFDIRIPDFKEQIVTFSKSDRNSMSISKELNEESSSADFTYETSKDEETLQIRVEGNIDSGRVKILLKQPDGSVYNEYTLSSLAGVDWNQTIRLNDPDVPGMAGKWTVSISAEKAKGHYTVRLR